MTELYSEIEYECKKQKRLHCKHYGKWALLRPKDKSSRGDIKTLKETDDLKGFLGKMVLERELPYDLLSDEDREVADEAWEEHQEVCSECVNHPCK